MKNIVKLIAYIILAITLSSCSNEPNNITGAGSSFIYPALSIWAKDYASQGGTKINYQAIGSGGGLQQIYSHTIDFAASDMPLTLSQLKQHKLMQFPMLIGGIVIAVNIPGVKNNQLTLNGSILANIYLGKIRYWDARVIKHLNPHVKLPHHKIVTIHRADGSGTTFNFTHYLSKINSYWKQHIGANTVVSWPGNGIGAKGNAGVAAQVMQTTYSIGYVEYAFAIQTHMPITKLQNSAGKTLIASEKSFAAAAKNAKWKASNGFHLILTNQPGLESWPIVATTFILIPQHETNAKIKQKVLRFFRWCFKHGSASASKLDYVAIPKAVYQKILTTF